MPRPYPVPDNEAHRLAAVAAYGLMDTPPEQDFDRLAALAARVFDVPTVLISVVSDERQFFKSRIGFEQCETSREVSFCAHAIAQDDILIVPDTTKDPRFSSNPLVLGPPFIRFYAGYPLTVSGGLKIGTLCLIDTKPREGFSSNEQADLADIAALVVDQIELRHLKRAEGGDRSRFEHIAATSPDAIICSDAHGAISFWNHAAEALFGYSSREIGDKKTYELVPSSWRPAFEEALEKIGHGDLDVIPDQAIELSGLRKNGEEFAAEFSFSTWRDGDVVSIGAIVRDITERRQSQDRLYRLASLDTLTELPNRGAWRQKLEETMSAGRPCTVMLLDLDGFKEVNDVFGHSAGDIVLRTVARRLEEVCEDALLVGRLGGDEFVALLAGNDERTAMTIAGRLTDAICRPIPLTADRCNVGVSIGIALSPAHGSTPHDLLSSADLALYRSKAIGKGKQTLFEPYMRDVAVARRSFEQELRHAFEQGEFELYYQPQVGLFDGKVRGAEALLRWNHPTRGLLSPASFIDVLSHKPSAPAVGEWILEAACRQAVIWRQAIPDFRIGVNLFESHFKSGHFLESVTRALGATGLPPQGLELELVENILLSNDTTTLKLLQALRALGVGLAFDDYGTGFASLSLLKRYPVTRIKIDRSFIADMTVDEEDAAIVRALMYLGRSFGMQIIAEGVEQEAQVSFLQEKMFVDAAQKDGLEAQGYLFSRPVSAQLFDQNFVQPARTQDVA